MTRGPYGGRGSNMIVCLGHIGLVEVAMILSSFRQIT